MVGTGRFELPQARLGRAPLAGLIEQTSAARLFALGRSRSAVPPGRCIDKLGLRRELNGRDGQI